MDQDLKDKILQLQDTIPRRQFWMIKDHKLIEVDNRGNPIPSPLRYRNGKPIILSSSPPDWN